MAAVRARKIITLHSYRGGTGKTTLTANLATAVAARGFRVGVVDSDLRSPGIHLIFGFTPARDQWTLNDFLQGRCDIDACAHRVVTTRPPPAGPIFLIPASSQLVDITRVLKSGFDLERLTEGLRTVPDKLDLDYLFVDTHPGLDEQTVLCTGLSRLLILLLRPDQQDYRGTGLLVEEARKLEVPAIGLVANKVLRHLEPALLEKKLQDMYNSPLIGQLPFSQDVMASESGGVLVLNRSRNTWSQAVQRLAGQIVAM